MITIQDLTKYYGDFCAVDKINFNIDKGEILGLLGPNGAGKSTTLRILTCYMKPTSGNIKVKDLDIHNNALEIKKMLGYLPESAPLYKQMIVFDYLSMVADIREIDYKYRNKRIHELADLCGINEVMHKNIDELSKGYKQRVGLAHAMMSDPDILVLDEPTSGLDPNQIIDVREIIKEIGKTKTVIISTHILSEVEATCDRVVIINKGNIVADDTTDKLRKATGAEYTIKLSLQDASFEAAKAKLTPIQGIKSVTVDTAHNNNLTNLQIEVSSEKDLRPEVYNVIKNNDWVIMEFMREIKSLENIFRQLTRENENG